MFYPLVSVLVTVSIFPFTKAYLKPDFCPITKKKHPHEEISTFLWRIERDPPSYFFGTIHVPYTEVWRYISPTAKDAFRNAHSVVLELDLSNPSTINHLRRCQLLPRGQLLTDILSGDMLRRLELHLDYIKSQMSDWMGLQHNAFMDPFAHEKAEILFANIAGTWRRRRPIWLLLMLNSLNEADIRSRSSPVLDLFLAQEANQRGQTLQAIEKVREQCRPLNKLDNHQVVLALNQTLTRLENLRRSEAHIRSSDQDKTEPESGPKPDDQLYLSRNLLRHYQCGSLDESVFMQDTMRLPLETDNEQSFGGNKGKMTSLDEYFHEKLIVNRNLRMADRVDQLLKKHAHKSLFFAFGAGHFLGDTNLIDLVRQSGYRITAVQARSPEETPDKAPRKIKSYFKEKPQKSAAVDVVSSAWLKRDLVAKSGAIRTGEAGTGQQKRQFEELWIRADDFTSKPWQEIEFGGGESKRGRNLDMQSDMSVDDFGPKVDEIYFIHHTSAASDLHNYYYCSTNFWIRFILTTFILLVLNMT